MATYTPEQFNRLLDRFAQGLPKAIADATVAAGVDINEKIKGRIFNTSGTRDTEGNTRTYKSSQWKKKRAAKGLQISTVDLIFNGDLQRSPKLVKQAKQVDLKIFGDLNVKKARGNEKRFPSKEVFSANEAEVESAIEAFEEKITDYIQSIF